MFIHGEDQCWAGIRFFLIPVGFGFHKIDYKRFWFLLFNLKKKIIHQVRVSIFLQKKKPVLTMLILINLKTTGHHLVVLTNWLLHLFSNKKIIFQNINFFKFKFYSSKSKNHNLCYKQFFKT